MSIVLLLLAIAWFAMMAWLRVSALVGRHGVIHNPARQVRQAVSFRERLERKLHVHC